LDGQPVAPNRSAGTIYDTGFTIELSWPPALAPLDPADLSISVYLTPDRLVVPGTYTLTGGASFRRASLLEDSDIHRSEEALRGEVTIAGGTRCDTPKNLAERCLYTGTFWFDTEHHRVTDGAFQVWFTSYTSHP
jgi:hypothetical protein